MNQRFLPMLWLWVIAGACLPASALPARLEVIDHRTEHEGLPDNAIAAVRPAGDSAVFIASAGGLFVLSDDFLLPIFPNVPVLALSQDPGGDLWAATSAGLIYRVTDRDGLWTAARFGVDKAKKITAIAAGLGALIFGTDSGLYYAGPDGLTHTIITQTGFSALAATEDGTIIAGARDRAHKKGGLLIIGGTFAARTGWVDEISGSAVGVLFVDGDRLLIGTDAGTLFILDAAGIRNAVLTGNPGRITALLVQDGITLVGCKSGLYASTGGGAFEPVPAAPSGVTALSPGPRKSVWVGTESDGVYLVRVRP